MSRPISRRATPGNFLLAPRDGHAKFDSNLTILLGARTIPAILPSAAALRQTMLQTVVPEITQEGVAR
jgi:hypothetical protein